jgi:hypothetical protein
MDKTLPIISQEAKLNDAQATFNEYILKISELKTEIDEVERQIEAAKARVEKEIAPLQAQVVDCRQAYVERLDEACEMFYYSMYEKRQMKAMILEEGFTLISQAGRKQLKPVYDKYATTPYDEQEQEANAAANEFIRDFVKDNFGVDAENLDLEDWESFKDLSKKLPKAVSESEGFLGGTDLKKQSRTLYTHLAKTLHPDAETDAAKKEEKTVLMQKLTKAYKSNDFFELLRMQTQYADEEAPLKLDEELLEAYNETLRRQIMEQEIQLKVLKNPPEPMPNIYAEYCGNTAEEIDRKFAENKAHWQEDVQNHVMFLSQIEDRYALRRYLRNMRHEKPEEDTLALSDIFPVLKFWGL